MPNLFDMLHNCVVALLSLVLVLGPQEQVQADLLPGDLLHCSSQVYCFSAELLQLQLSPSLACIQLTGADSRHCQL